MSDLKQQPSADNAPSMTRDKFDGLMLGLLIGSYICELRAGDKASHNAMSIMQYRTTAALMIEQGKPLPSWSVQ
jgi:hypothetical protein